MCFMDAVDPCFPELENKFKSPDPLKSMLRWLYRGLQSSCQFRNSNVCTCALLFLHLSREECCLLQLYNVDSVQI